MNKIQRCVIKKTSFFFEEINAFILQGYIKKVTENT